MGNLFLKVFHEEPIQSYSLETLKGGLICFCYSGGSLTTTCPCDGPQVLCGCHGPESKNTCSPVNPIKPPIQIDPSIPLE